MLEDESVSEYNMLAIETSKPHALSGRRVTKLDQDRYISVNDKEMQDRGQVKNGNNSSRSSCEDFRDGAVNRTVETASYVKKKSRRASNQNIVTKETVTGEITTKIPKNKFQDDSKQKTGKDDQSGSSFGLKKKSRLNGHKDVLKDGLGTLDKSKSTRPRMKNDFENPKRDLLGVGIIREKGGYIVPLRDSSSYSDFTHLNRDESEKPLKRLTSANRPKSAGQSMFMTDDLSDSDDSFYDGEIEVVDLDDPVFAYEREFERSKSSGNALKSNSSPRDIPTEELNKIPSYHDDMENTYKQTVLSPDSGGGLHGKRPKSDRNYDAYPISRPSTSHGRRRAQSEPEIERKSMIPVKSDFQKYKPNNKQMSLQVMRDNLYSHSVDKVISKYSGLAVKKGSSNIPKQTNAQFPRGDMYQARAPLPRKLKPILRRGKLGHVNPPEQGEIDY